MFLAQCAAECGHSLVGGDGTSKFGADLHVCVSCRFCITLYTQPMKDWHIDLVLKKQLIAGWQEPDQLGACYVVPPVGSFIEHETGCSVDRGGRIAGMFGLPWCQEGTRKRSEGQVHRRLAKFPRGWDKVEWLGFPVHLPAQRDELKWKTQMPPDNAGVRLTGPHDVGVWADCAPEAEIAM